MSDIVVGASVSWRKRWFGGQDEVMVGTVIELGSTPFRAHAWVSVEHDQSPQFAFIDRLTRIDAEPQAADEYAAMLGWAGSTL